MASQSLLFKVVIFIFQQKKREPDRQQNIRQLTWTITDQWYDHNTLHFPSSWSKLKFEGEH